MAVITFPSTLSASKATWSQQRKDVAYNSIFGSQAVEVASPVWNATVEAVPMHDSDSGEWKALLMKLRGKTNQLELWDMGRPDPVGTMRGTMTLSPNMLSYPDDLDNAYWTKSNVTVTANTTGVYDTVDDASAAASGFITKVLTSYDQSKTWQASVDVLKDATPAATRFCSLRVDYLTGGTAEFYSVGLDTSTGDIAARLDATAADIAVVDNGTYWALTVKGRVVDTANTSVACRFFPATGAGTVGGAASVATTGSCQIKNLRLRTLNLQGDTSAHIYASGETSKTLVQGDLIGVGTGATQQVVMVTENATSDSSAIINVTFEPPLRNDHAIDASVTWDKPKALFRRTDSQAGWEYSNGTFVSGFTLNLVEDWRP